MFVFRVLIFFFFLVLLCSFLASLAPAGFVSSWFHYDVSGVAFPIQSEFCAFFLPCLFLLSVCFYPCVFEFFEVLLVFGSQFPQHILEDFAPVDRCECPAVIFLAVCFVYFALFLCCFLFVLNFF